MGYPHPPGCNMTQDILFKKSPKSPASALLHHQPTQRPVAKRMENFISAMVKTARQSQYNHFRRCTRRPKAIKPGKSTLTKRLSDTMPALVHSGMAIAKTIYSA